MEFPVHVPVGPWRLHPHPLFEALAYVVGFQLYLLLRRRQGDAFAPVRPVLVLAAVAGAFVGSRALALLEDPAATWAGRADIATWMAGKTIVGGLLGGWGAVELAKLGLQVRGATADLYPVPICIAIATGRLGCFLTGLEDRTHGSATALPWGVDFGDGVARHPTQLYEAAFVLLVAWLLLPTVARRRATAPAATAALPPAGRRWA
ncbi:MAG TPA: prolipoprotein diacylglyceryl transferase family protein, partial [Candidatus Thermoplasmatota archaeon]|nr:prolipoprotein diacylglyceryl transferase family protein [Candidatus Thermoplasmatota archaeon]